MPTSHCVDLRLDSMYSWEGKSKYIESTFVKLEADLANDILLQEAARTCEIVFSTSPDQSEVRKYLEMRCLPEHLIEGYPGNFIKNTVSTCLRLGTLAALERGLHCARPAVAVLILNELRKHMNSKTGRRYIPWYV